jgi:hypothetical protein
VFEKLLPANAVREILIINESSNISFCTINSSLINPCQEQNRDRLQYDTQHKKAEGRAIETELTE